MTHQDIITHLCQLQPHRVVHKITTENVISEIVRHMGKEAHRAGSIASEVTNLGSVRSSSRDFGLDRGLRARISEFHLFGPAWGEWKTEKLEWLTQLSEKTSSKTITIKRWLVGSFLKYQDVQWTC